MPVQYVQYGGAQIMQPPYVAENVGFYAFLVKADTAALQTMLDDRLNRPSGGAVRFEPAGPFVIFAFNKFGKIFSQNPPDRDKGWFTEQEFGIWVRVVDRKTERSMWFNPYILVDNSYAMASGREVYGFPKAFGWLDIPDDPSTATELSLETLILSEFSPETRAERKRLVRAVQTSKGTDWLEIAEEAADFLLEVLGVDAESQDKAELIINSLKDLVEREQPMVFLKQFPAAGTPGLACFQSIVETTATATAIHNVALVPGEWRIEITPADSHPIARELGIAVGADHMVPSLFQFWLSFDMTFGLGTDVWTAPAGNEPPAKPRKIAILGGGVGSMTTALELTSAPDWKSRYDITVYQMGWRLGGKGASGRGQSNRIEEHGLHVWLGFYENAFRIIRQVYKENEVNRPPGSILRTWDEAFKPHSFIALTDRIPDRSGGHWNTWCVPFPTVPGTPGDGQPLTLWDAFVRVLGWLEVIFEKSAFHARSRPAAHHASFISDLRGFFGDVKTAAEDAALLTELVTIRKMSSELDPDSRRHPPLVHKGLAALLDRFRKSLREQLQPAVDSGDPDSRRLLEIFEFAIAVGYGLLEDGYFLDPSRLNSVRGDFQKWLADHGAGPLGCDITQSAILRGLYDLVFAYENGDVGSPSFDAGPALRSSLLIVGAYKGSVFWKMRAGMGDAIFGPIYQVLLDRGVKFEFFHRIEELVLNPLGTAVEAIRIGVQAEIADGVIAYEPLETCEDLACWPAAPRYKLLKRGQALRDGKVNLESFWTTWPDAKEKTLRAGEDFDEVVLGISIAYLPWLFRDLKQLPECFQLMLANVQTVRTQAFQLWVNQNLDGLGWHHGDVVLDAYANPMNTWAVMDQLIVREGWPPGSVKGIHYFCGPMAGGIPPRTETGFPAEALDAVKGAVDEFMLNHLPFLWPKMNDGDLKIVSEFLKANIDPSDRYVISAAGSTQYRLRANESGIDNLVLAGDWTNNGFNAGCVEAAVMSGIQAANAIEGRPLDDGIDGPLSSQLRSAAAVAAA